VAAMRVLYLMFFIIFIVLQSVNRLLVLQKH